MQETDSGPVSMNWPIEPVKLHLSFLNFLRKQPSARVPDNILSIESLYRYNVLYSGAKILNHWSPRNTLHFMDDAVSDTIRKVVCQHCEFSTTLLDKHQSNKKGSQSRARLSCQFSSLEIQLVRWSVVNGYPE